MNQLRCANLTVYIHSAAGRIGSGIDNGDYSEKELEEMEEVLDGIEKKLDSMVK